MKNSLKIRNIDILKAAGPILDYVMARLYDAGAPIKPKSLTKCNTTKEDYEITGDLRLETCKETGDITYYW